MARVTSYVLTNKNNHNYDQSRHISSSCLLDVAAALLVLAVLQRIRRYRNRISKLEYYILRNCKCVR